MGLALSLCSDGIVSMKYSAVLRPPFRVRRGLFIAVPQPPHCRAASKTRSTIQRFVSANSYGRSRFLGTRHSLHQPVEIADRYSLRILPSRLKIPTITNHRTAVRNDVKAQLGFLRNDEEQEQAFGTDHLRSCGASPASSSLFKPAPSEHLPNLVWCVPRSPPVATFIFPTWKCLPQMRSKIKDMVRITKGQKRGLLRP